ncbi:MAG: hypothetical protein IPM54_06265 [Polyangiaceae bacterium]|nr:hypothetical protein [Polyangiaceae bacterium]
MMRHAGSILLAVTVGFLFAADGCAINPWSTPDINYQSVGGAPSTASSGGGGTGGAMPCTCSDDVNACTDDLVDQECPGGDANACHTAVVGRECTLDGGPGACDSTGECKSCLECSDPECTKRCNGQLCQTGDVCESGFCGDGYCCDSACEGPCNACNRVLGDMLAVACWHEGRLQRERAV